VVDVSSPIREQAVRPNQPLYFPRDPRMLDESMSDVRSKAFPVIAIATATVAVLLSMIALIVVARRSPKSSDGAIALETTVAAADIVKLKRDTFELAKDGEEVIGVRVVDDKLREALGLQRTDVITALAGRAIHREYDLTDAVVGSSTLDASMLYVDLLRDDQPLLLRWKLDGSLRTMRKNDSASQPAKPTDPLANPFGGYGGSLTARDPLLDTIKKYDTFHYELPKSTVERALANPMDFAKGARVVPAMSMGRTEGMKLYAIRPNSIYAALGFSNGDLIRTVNGFELTGMDKALEIYTRLRDASSLEIEIVRRGRDETIRIDIR
jgi:S1-C subfamily serine protease